ncbi:DUF4097 family beta strand repeat-containing protein [Oceanobacillus halophilus]|uniref:DUF4097 domain-containing protein n=1 Tax=Oceanobacillus halophilus TaxID=930130 RepID=A0A495A076_9BACI|nr:DUF4097 family beta strand repeat-containing protein [Oceanobacillus halophilus]RKQ32675.1 hypothetical protein D8M06_12135 [Oceanobacillus halophilus]
MKKLFIIIIALIVVIVVSMLIDFPFGSNGTNEMEIKQDFDKLAVETENAKVIVVPVNADTARLELSGNKNNKYKLDARVKGGSLEVDVDDRWFEWISVDLFSISKQPTLSVYLPQKQYNNVEISTNNGMIDASELEAEDIYVETDNGKIVLNEIRSTFIEAKADNGEIVLENVEGELISKTDNGKMTLITDSLDRPIEMKTDNGAINILTKRKPSNATFDIKVDNGFVNIFGESIYDTIIGNGDNRIKLTTDNGKITVEKNK